MSSAALSMQHARLLALPSELRVLILTYALPEEILSNDGEFIPCEYPTHRHLSKPECWSRTSSGSVCTSLFSLLFINEQLREDVLPLVHCHTHILIDGPSCLSTVLPCLASIFESDPNAVVPFRWKLRSRNATRVSILKTISPKRKRDSYARARIIRRLLDSSFHVGDEAQIDRIANEHQLYLTYGDIELSPTPRDSPSDVEMVFLEGFLPFIIKRLPEGRRARRLISQTNIHRRLLDRNETAKAPPIDLHELYTSGRQTI